MDPLVWARPYGYIPWLLTCPTNTLLSLSLSHTRTLIQVYIYSGYKSVVRFRQTFSSLFIPHTTSPLLKPLDIFLQKLLSTPPSHFLLLLKEDKKVIHRKKKKSTEEKKCHVNFEGNVSWARKKKSIQNLPNHILTLHKTNSPSLSAKHKSFYFTF